MIYFCQMTVTLYYIHLQGDHTQTAAVGLGNMIVAGLGTSVLDAFAAEIPVVSTDVGGIPEMITHDITGKLVKSRDSKDIAVQVLDLLENQKLAHQIVINAKNKLENFTSARMAEKTIKVYESIL